MMFHDKIHKSFVRVNTFPIGLSINVPWTVILVDNQNVNNYSQIEIMMMGQL